MCSLRRIARSSLLSLGLTYGRTADPRAIERFLEMVRPVETQHELIRLGGDTQFKIRID